MQKKPEVGPIEGNARESKLKAYLGPIVILIMLGAILFITAGSFRFWEAWIFWLQISALTLFITAYFLKKDPKLLSRRGQTKEKETTQKIPSYLATLNLFGYLIPGLDFRFHWSAVPFWVVIAANAIVFLGYTYIILVFKENSYASTIIHVEEDQQVITTGPYAIVRHPMYTGMLLMTLFTPLALGSYWALIPSFLLFIPYLVLRIKGEEETLLRDLPGYKDYCLKTRYRLIPSVW